MDFSINDKQNILEQTLKDLSIRARGGVVLYLIIWLVTAFWADFLHKVPLFFYINTASLIFLSLIRLGYYIVYKKYAQKYTHKMYNILVTLILLNAFHWGILSAWILFNPEFQLIHYPYLVILSALAIGGTSSLSISTWIRRLFPFFIFTPSLIMGLITHSNEDIIMIILGMISMVYVWSTSKATQFDYQKAVINHKIFEKKAHYMEELSVTDELTGLKNRLYFNKKFSKSLALCIEKKLPLSILMIDIDHFKNFNDTYGHLCGDRCLQAVARVLEKTIKNASQNLSRFGGEEFIVILENTYQKEAIKLANNIVLNVANSSLKLSQTKKVKISCSVGISSFIPRGIKEGEILISDADKALYRAKKEGRNRYCVLS